MHQHATGAGGGYSKKTSLDSLRLINNLPPIKLNEALNYLKLLSQIPEEKLDTAREYLESLGWTKLALEVAEKEWE